MIIEFKREKINLRELGKKLYEEGKLSSSVSAYRSALEKDPFDYELNALLAELLTEADVCREAINCWYRALSVAQTNEQLARAYNGLGANYYFLGEDFSALANFGMQISLDNEGEYEYNDVIVDLQEEMMSFEGEPSFTLVHDAEKEDPDKKKIDEARLLVASEKIDEALRLLTTIKDSSPSYIKALEEICFILVLQGRQDVAIDVADQIKLTNPNSFFASLATCSYYHSIKDKENLDKSFDEIMKMQGGEDRNLHLLMLSLDVEKEREALVYAENILTENPCNYNVLYVRGLVKYNLGDIEGAKADFIKVNTFAPGVAVKETLRKILSEDNRPTRLEYYIDTRDADVKYYVKTISEGVARMQDKKEFTFEELKTMADCVIGCKMLNMMGSIIQLGFSMDAGKTFEYLRLRLLDSTVGDMLKKTMLKELILLGINVPVKCVISDRFKTFTINNLRFTGLNADFFEEAYAEALSVTYLMGEDPSRLKRRFKSLKKQYDESDISIEKPASLAGAVVKGLKLIKDMSNEMFAGLFGVSTEEIENAERAIEKRSKDETD